MESLRRASKIMKLQFCFIILILSATTGCTTLSSIGLPFGSSNNRMLDTAREISEAPGRSVLVPKELAKQPLDTYIVEVGDTILIEPVKFDATVRLPGDQIVKPDGFISLGEFGQYLAVHKTLEQIQSEVSSMIDQRIRIQLESDYAVELKRRESNGTEASAAADLEELDALEKRIREAITQNEISARLINWDSKRIYVLGEVNSPGSFNYRGNETVLDAIIEAGGITTKADRHQVIVSRPTPGSSCRIVMKMCYDQVVQLGDSSTNYQLLPGDRVFIPSLTFKDDLIKSINPDRFDRCPRCADSQRGCDLPTDCE